MPSYGFGRPGSPVGGQGDGYRRPVYGAKEVVGGFAILEAKSKAEAIELTKNFLIHVGQGECELRQLCEAAAGQPHRSGVLEEAEVA